MIKTILTILGSGIAAHLGAKIAVGQKRFHIKVDQEKNEITLEPMGKPGKVVFLDDATQQELEEMAKPKDLRDFFSGFAKPSKEK